MDDSCIWARRPRHINSAIGILNYNVPVRYTWTGPINPQLYSDSLIHLSKCTEHNLNLLERSRHQPHISQTNDYQRKSSNGQSSLTDFGIIFTPRDTVTNLARLSVFDDDASSTESVSAPVSHCYLCSTLDEHRSHLLTLQKPKKRPKPRICYIAPPLE